MKGQPVQKPTPPMYSSGNNLESAKFAAANQLGMSTSFLPAPIIALTTEMYYEQAATTGWRRAPDMIVYRDHMVVADTPPEAAELERNFLPTLLRNTIARNMSTNRTEVLPRIRAVSPALAAVGG